MHLLHRLGTVVGMLRCPTMRSVVCTHPPLYFTSPLDGLFNPIQYKRNVSTDHKCPSNVHVLKLTLSEAGRTFKTGGPVGSLKSTVDGKSLFS